MQRRATNRFGLVLVLAAATLGGACGGTQTTSHGSAKTTEPKTEMTAHAPYVDPTYKPSPTVLVSLAIAPVSGAGVLTERVDQGFENAFMNTPGLELRGMPSQFRQRMNGNRNLVQIIDRISAQSYTPQDLAAGVGLKQILSPKEMEDLRQTLNSCTMLLLPAQFETKLDGQRTLGHALARTYDLSSGRVLLQNTYEVTIPEAGDAGQRRATVDLILAIQDDYANHMILQE